MMIKYQNLKKRDIYLNKLISFKDTEPIKVVTGIRRSGKSTLLKLMVQHLLENGVEENQIIEMNFESFKFKKMNVEELYYYIENKIRKDKRTYLFFDEIQRIEAWEDAVNSFRVDFDCDIYITGSNAYLLSSEYATYLSGRCVEIKMLPLSFKEFLDFNNLEIKEVNSLNLQKKVIFDKDNIQHDIKEIFNAYLKFGGMPAIADVGLQQDKAMTLLDGIYSTIVVRDILEREKRRDQKRITDSFLLRKIVLYLADNIGNNISLSNVGNVLANEGLLSEENKKNKPSTHTIQAYVEALLEIYFFYEIKRFDIKGKEYLKTLGKYYIVDIGLRNYLLDFRDQDRGHIIENIVYFELLRRGYDVSIGKIDNSEIDFIARKYNDKIYIQVTESMLGENVRKRELSPLYEIKDNYEKIILCLDDVQYASYEGIKVLNLIDWLLSNN